MRFENVCIESIAVTLPSEIVSSEEIEKKLAPAYERLRLPAGRLELMTGIRERRFWKPGTLPGSMSILSGQLALNEAEISPDRIGALIHGSVCRDHLEPATACRVHDGLALPLDCTIYDTSNACLGILNGMYQAANMIELGQIEAAIVVGSEGSRQLVETTIEQLNTDPRWNRKTVKLAVASLTIGSASCAVVLTNRSLSTTQNRITDIVTVANTKHHRLCHSGQDEAAADGMHPMMTTDSEALMREGIETGRLAFKKLVESAGDDARWDRTFCHQVGATHRKLMLESLGLDPVNDFTTFEWLGNTGSAALPVTLAMGLKEGFATPNQKLALLGIGSGINSVMMSVDWNKTKVAQQTEPS